MRLHVYCDLMLITSCQKQFVEAPFVLLAAAFIKQSIYIVWSLVFNNGTHAQSAGTLHNQ